MARVDILKAKMDQLIVELDEEKILRRNLQAMNEEISIESQKQGANIELLMAKNIKREEEILLLKENRMNDSDHSLKQQNFQPTEKMNDDSSPRLPPSSCR